MGRRQMSKEDLVEFLMQKDETVIKVAIMYAESNLRYGVDVTEKWETAVQQTFALRKAEERGFIDGQNSMKSAREQYDGYDGNFIL